MKSIQQVLAVLSKCEQRAPSGRSPQDNPKDEEDAAYRGAWGNKGKAPFGRPLRAAFYQFLPEAPRHTSPNIDGCREYVRQINETIERQCWSSLEMNRLRQLRTIWQRRADGLDARYIASGNAGGVTNRVAKARGRAGSGRSVFEAIQTAIADSAKGVKVATSPTQKFITDPRWPLGRHNPDRRA